MPHQFMSVACKKCGEIYCPVCHKKCIQCGKVDVADAKTMQIREQMRRHMKNINHIGENHG